MLQMTTVQASSAAVNADRSVTPFAGRAVIDNVFIENLYFSAVVGPDAWGRSDKQQQILVSIYWYNDISGEDNINSTLSYSKMSKDIIEAIEGHQKGFSSVEAVMDLILFVAVDKNWGGTALELEIHLPKALLQTEKGLRYRRGYVPHGQAIDRMPFPRSKLYPSTVIGDIHAACIIGINPHERKTKQQIKLQLIIEEDLEAGAQTGIKSHWQGLTKNALEVR